MAVGTRVDVVMIGDAGSSPTGSFIVTGDYDPQPFGVYLFGFNFRHGIQPNSRHAFVHSITGLGMTWEHIDNLVINAVSLVDYHAHLYLAVGAPQGGPVVVELHESIGFPESIPDAGQAVVQEISYSLHRLTGVARTDVLDIVRQTHRPVFSAPITNLAIMPNPIGDPRNLLFALTDQSGRPPLPNDFQPVVREEENLGPDSASHSVWRTNGGPRTSTWFNQTGGQNGAIIVEFGYRPIPPLRQRQRDK